MPGKVSVPRRFAEVMLIKFPAYQNTTALCRENSGLLGLEEGPSAFLLHPNVLRASTLIFFQKSSELSHQRGSAGYLRSSAGRARQQTPTHADWSSTLLLFAWLPVKWEEAAIISLLDTLDIVLNRTVTSVLLVTSCREEMGQSQLTASHSGSASNWEWWSQAAEPPPLDQFLAELFFFQVCHQALSLNSPCTGTVVIRR